MWVAQRMAFWETVSAFTRRMETASTVPMSEMQSPSFVLSELSVEKRNVAYIFENTLRYITPEFHELRSLYGNEVHNFANLISVISIINCSINLSLLVCVGVYVIFVLWVRVQPLNHLYVNCLMILSLPRTVQKQVYKFYAKEEEELEIQA
eukprot:CAMPEP_0206263346 /NCGR_PEP_ID=MMETSP0047_2-20121206/28767_1 /ASSEMBLY_ACC=CAM_ASM_000192 /TAXON_ID=195065 /ORGANISM="Chroomonas mesostigmatica_cf, Strain CCMP1168" /LENGTH=150 /DNA_ID=CAMNT_0053690877 /DNA_START=72 /DNA_END=520 /DNA_ORIENTATION=-